MNLSRIIIVTLSLVFFSYALYCCARIEGFVSTDKSVVKNHRIVVSLSTLPSRIHLVKKVIDDILYNQTMKPDAVYLNIPAFSKREKVPYIVPANLEPYVNYSSSDYGPLTKLLPTLKVETDPETVIICIDDDLLYDPNLIRHLYTCAQHTKFESCVAVTGWDFINVFNQVALPLKVVSYGLLENALKRVQILQCYQGVLYMRKFFDAQRLKDEMCAACFTLDDIYISQHLRSRGVSILAIEGNLKHETVETTDESKLSVHNLTHNTWIKCIKNDFR